MNKRIKKKKAKQQAQIIDLKNQALINLNDKMISVAKSLENVCNDISKAINEVDWYSAVKLIEDTCKGTTKALDEVDWYRIFKECFENHSDDNN